jgi:thiamine-phosphate pyrophosphorylase
MAAPSASVRLLSARARLLNAVARAHIPALYFFTDPDRVRDPCAVAARLPRGAAIVYRHFGVKHRLREAQALARLAKRRGLTLLIGADEALAKCVGAHGVHLPESAARTLPRLRARHRAWLITIAAHTPASLTKLQRSGADAVVLAPLLPSRSSAARATIGARSGAALAQRAACPVVALGGVHARTRIAPGFAGLAAIDAFLDA